MVLNSGFDIGLEDWRAAVRFTHCPVWLDIHSLILSKKLDKPRHYVSFVEWREWAAGVEYLQANRAEVASLLGFPDENPEEEDLKRFGRQAIEAGVRTVFVTLGEEGILVFTPEGSEIISPSEQGHIVDTTGCGDVFCGGAVAKLAEGKDPYQAAQFAVDLATQAASVVGIPATYRSIQQKSP
jgi:sugar/nucleoside kinase (ribokinase family)